MIFATNSLNSARSIYGALLWLEGFLGFEPRVVTSKVRLAAKVKQLSEAIRAVTRLCLL
jgi:hypothetical protein